MIGVRWLLPVLAAGAALAQTPTPFSYRVRVGTQVRDLLAANAIAEVPANALGVPAQAEVTITRTSGVPVTINQVTVTGADFQLAAPPELPAVLGLGRSLTVLVNFLPTSSRATEARLAFGFLEGNRSDSTGITLRGLTPELVVAYTPPNGNATQVNPGGTILFPATSLDTTATAQVVITNRGSGAGAINAISVTGASFTLAGVPLLPATIDAGRDLRFSLQFSPTQVATETGSLRIEALNVTSTFAVQGAGGSPLAYEVVQDSGASPLVPNQTLALADTRLGEKTTALVRLRNAGPSSATISAISVSGAGYSLSDLPVAPLTLPVGAGTSFSLIFNPSTAGRALGRLRIGNDNFDLASTALGANLQFNYVAGGVTFPAQAGATIVVPPAAVGQTSQIQFSLTNTGTAAAAISSISVSSTGNVFSLAGLPPLPLSVSPGATLPFTISFIPVQLGPNTGSLRVDTQSFTLSGVGNNPAPLPEYSFSGVSGILDPMQQPAVGLSLNAPYPLPLSGVLSLAFTSEVFSNDPSVQFSSGGRTVTFTVPAGSREAIFPNGQNQIRLQTGSVAGTLTLTPSFATAEGGVILTPTTPPALNLTLPQSAPRLLSLTLTNRTTNGFTLLVTGFATGRALTQMDFQFTPAQGENVPTSRVTVNVEPSFAAWYQNAQSTAFGSQFTASVPFTLQGDVKRVSNVVDTVQSVAVTLTNRQGVSASRSIELR